MLLSRGNLLSCIKKTKLILPRSTCNNDQLEKTYYKIYPILERTELPCYAVCFAFNNYAIEYIIVLDFLTTFAF